MKTWAEVSSQQSYLFINLKNNKPLSNKIVFMVFAASSIRLWTIWVVPWTETHLKSWARARSYSLRPEYNPVSSYKQDQHLTGFKTEVQDCYSQADVKE